ncbi:MAG TPA: protein translocase subunit SecF [Tepidiformaceae bacterium]|nr:protein translocase subunit SecF [Tepidiformaceae bacterium]
MLDFAGKRWYYLSVSLALMLIAATALALWQLRPGIEFTSGSQFTIEFTERSVSQAEVRSALADLGHPEARVQGAGSNRYLIRTKELENAPPTSGGEGPTVDGEIDSIMASLQQRFGAVTRAEFSTVSGTVSSEIVRNATIAVVAASVMILLYIWWAFRELDRPFRYGACAIIAVVHDALIVLGLFAILGQFNNVEVDVAFLTAILTVIGFSVHDTIVVFDRMREIIRNDPYIPFNEAVNSAMTDTLARSLNTSLVVIFTTLAMLLLGGETIRYFLLALLVGVVAGTYSSIGVSVQALVAWENGDIGRFWRRLRGRPDPENLAPDPA